MKKRVLKNLVLMAMVCILFVTEDVKADVLNNSVGAIEENEKTKDGEIAYLEYSGKIKRDNFKLHAKTKSSNKQKEINFPKLLGSNNRSNTLRDNYRYNGSIDSEGEMKLCELSIDSKCKTTVYLQMDNTLDADLYLFAYDQVTDNFTLITGSVREGKGVAEYVTSVLSPGIYYIAFAGNEGTGNFNFVYHESTIDVKNELNESPSSATEVSLDSNIVGVIDSPFDSDYYKITVSKPTVIDYSISSAYDYTIEYKNKEGEGADISSINSGTNMVKLMPGTYYFLVESKQYKYSSTSTYTVNFTKISEWNTVENMDYKYEYKCHKANVIFQCDAQGKNYYVNGNPININYHYSAGSSVGAQSYDIRIQPNSDMWVDLANNKPKIVYYHSSTKPAKKVSGRPALMVTFQSSEKFYSIHCTGAEVDSADNHWKEYDSVTVMIDPNNGDLIDIVTPNYFYDIASTGTNAIHYSTPYITEESTN